MNSLLNTFCEFFFNYFCEFFSEYLLCILFNSFCEFFSINFWILFEYLLWILSEYLLRILFEYSLWILLEQPSGNTLVFLNMFCEFFLNNFCEFFLNTFYEFLLNISRFKVYLEFLLGIHFEFQAAGVYGWGFILNYFEPQVNSLSLGVEAPAQRRQSVRCKAWMCHFPFLLHLYTCTFLAGSAKASLQIKCFINVFCQLPQVSSVAQNNTTL